MVSITWLLQGPGNIYKDKIAYSSELLASARHNRLDFSSLAFSTSSNVQISSYAFA